MQNCSIKMNWEMWLSLARASVIKGVPRRVRIYVEDRAIIPTHPQVPNTFPSLLLHSLDEVTINLG